MAFSKQTWLMVVTIGALLVACVAMLISLINVNQSMNSLKASIRGQELHSPAVSNDLEWAEPESGEELWERDDIQDDDEDGGGDAVGEPEDAEHLQPWQKNIRLPRSVLPIHYDLYLHPELKEGTFMGRVSIQIQSLEARDHFLVHVKHLDIEDARMTTTTDAAAAAPIDLMEVIEHKPNEFLVFRTKDQVPAGNYTLHIEFGGSLTRSITGFYKSVYTNGKGEKIPIATSKFQPTYARWAFPCFDEPSFKSTFSTTLVKPNSYIALSNMPVQNQKVDSPSKGLTEVEFMKSVPMVTYLACFIVCDFEYEEKFTQIHNTKFRVYATPTQKDRIKYSLDIGANITDYFESYFDVAYPLPKQDMIAIPDFVSGAMEHWGLITYRETNLLYDNLESSSYNQQRVALVVSHELAHQWFGNLVTLSWWDDLWLNEGFASYIEYKGVANYHPDWQIEDSFLTNDLQPVMELDSTINSHPIVQPVLHPDQITEIFDKITYSKGASVLRMLENFMGPEEFRLGISRFLEKYQYDNAVTNQLWKELESVSSKGLNVTHIMDTWTRQMGFPLITVEKLKDRVYRLRQSRFLLDPSKAGQGEPSPFDYKWDVFVTYRKSDAPQVVEEVWMHTTDEFVDVTVPADVEWIKFNVDQRGFYRVNYPIQQWKIFSDLLTANHKVLSASDRTHLISDVFALASTGAVDHSLALSMIKYLKYEESLAPWDAAYSLLIQLDQRLVNSDSYSHLRKFVRSLVDDHYERLGWNDRGSHVVRSNRVNILNLACKNGHPGCLKQAGDAFNAWIKDPSYYIPPNLRSLTYKYGITSRGDEKKWRIMFDRYVKEKNAQEKSKLMSGLARVGQPWIIKQFLSLAKNESLVRSQDYITCLIYISFNPVGTPIVWNFVREEWPYLVDRFSLNDRTLGRLPRRVTAAFSSQLQLDEMKAFFAKYPEAGAGARSRKQAIENVENNIKWLQQNEMDVSEWLKAQNYDE